jgi:hypothetical protein
MFTHDIVVGWYLATKTPIQIDETLFVDKSSTLINRCYKYNISPHSGHALFSSLLPDNFYYNRGDIMILEGILVRGTLRYHDLKNIYDKLKHEYGRSCSDNFITYSNIIV